MRLSLVLPLLLVSHSALALDEGEYQSARNKLVQKQAATDVLLKRLSTSIADPTGVSAGSGKAGSPEDVGPLFHVHDSFTRASLPVGRVIQGRLLNRLVVGSDGSPVLIEVGADQTTMSGLRLMGLARQAGTPGRLLVEVSKLLLRSGRAVPFQGVGLDLTGAFGLEAQVISGKALAVAGAMASSLIAGVAASQQTQSVTAMGFYQNQPTGRNAILQGVAQTAADQSKRFIDEATAEKPILIVEPETLVQVLVQEEVRF